MYTGFNLIIENNDFLFNNTEYYNAGLDIYKRHKKLTHSNLSSLIHNDIIDGDALQSLWFPSEIFNDKNFIFLSHSHKDEQLTIQLAGYLYKNFNILCFIDSCVWGYMDDLNKQLNNCNESPYYHNCHGCQCNTFSSNLSYVHMMLASALSTMIDKCECMFFINTPSSINICSKTESPWIYYELNIAAIIEKKTHIKTPVLEEHTMNFILKSIEFTPNLKNMIKINKDIIKQWEQRYKLHPHQNPYEILYKICGGIT